MSQRQRIQIAQKQRLALNSSLQASIRLLRSDTAGLTRYLEEQAAENPHLRLIAPDAPAVGEWLPRWTGVLPHSGRPRQGVDDNAAPAPSLIAHVMAAVQAMGLTRPTQRIALALIEALEPSGWLGQPTAEIARALQVPVDEVEAVLARLQTIEPAGLFARNLADCLRLQAVERGEYDSVMGRVLENLPLLASGQTERLAKTCGVDESDIARCFRRIRAMNPKPGSTFAHGAQHEPICREPDLIASPGPDGGWTVALNRSALPSLEIRADLPEGRDQQALASARQLGNMVQARNATLLLVGRAIVERQTAALREGPGALHPMTMAMLAEGLGLHVSTISRVVAGASLDSPQGVWWLRRMFSGARGGTPSPDDPGPAMSAAALRHKIGQIIAQEPPSRPLSDAALGDRLLAETGVRLARRTIAQYREAEGIPPAYRRKKRGETGA